MAEDLRVRFLASADAKAWVSVVCAITDDPKMVKTQFAHNGSGNEHIVKWIAEGG